MPKRNREESKEDRWRRKMKKYEEKLEGKRRKYSRIIYSDDEDDVYPQEHLENELDQSNNYTLPAESEEGLENKDSSETNDIIPSNDAEIDPILTNGDPAPLPPSETIAEPDNFDPQLLKALGDSEADIVEYGNDLQTDLAARFQKILTCGLNKDTKEDILKKYLFPKNVPLAKGPTLNPEIGAMLVETCKLRDKRLLAKQDQLGKALSALGNAITCLLKKTPDIPDIIRTLNDVGQLLADSHYAETDTRRSVIIPLIDKSLIDPFKDRKRDSLLFGENLGDLVKNSRGIKKTSQLIQAQTSSTTNLNGKGPSTRARYQHQRNSQMYTPRAGGPKPTTSYAYHAYSNRRRAPPPPPPHTRRPPPPQPPPARRQQPPPTRTPRYPTHR